MSSSSRTRALGVFVVAGLATAVLLPNACTPTDRRARAFQITQRDQLVGGPRALGEVGDFMLENDQIRVVIQGEGFSRGFGIYGGGLIDADLVRHDDAGGNSEGGGGKDNFGEMFSALFLEAMEPVEVPNPNDRGGPRLPAIEITSDGADGTAELTVRSKGSDFLGLTFNINNALLGEDKLLYTNVYRLRPGTNMLEIETTVQNIDRFDIDLPAPFAGIEVPAPTLDVMLFGAGNSVFVPLEAGFDIRYRLEELYQNPGQFELPAFPGLVTEFLASRGPDVSYGLVGDPEADTGYTFGLADPFYPESKRHSLLVPFLAQAFTGVFSARPPAELLANDEQPGGPDEFTWKRHFIVGSGDIASISDTVYAFLGDETGRLSGRVLESGTGQPVGGASVVVTDGDDVAKVTQCDVDAAGRFGANLRPGDYNARVIYEGRPTTAPKAFTIAADATAFVDLTVAQQAWVSVSIVDENQGSIPAKASVVGVGPEAFAGRLPREWLYDLSLGEHELYTDLVPDSTQDPQTRRYIEAFDYTSDGSVRLAVRPGEYVVFVGRGLEYERQEIPVTVAAGQTVQVNATLRRAIDTTGYIAADFHLHTANSLDSSSGLVESLVGYAGEGLEFVVATDHNFVTDLGPAIAEAGLEDLLGTVVGLELTTLDRGHFNGFPITKGTGTIERDSSGVPLGGTIASRTYGSFEWALQTPGEIFDTLRGLKTEDVDVIVQINHPRSPVLGYFADYGLDQDTLIPEGQGALLSPSPDAAPHFQPEVFSWDFDAIEIFNGKGFEDVHNFRVPDGLPVDAVFGQPLDPASCCPLTPGEIYFERGSFDCDETARDCTCNSVDAQAQIDLGKCEPFNLAFPGHVEDWFQILKTGKRLIGTANSDSHGAEKDEPGFPRTYVRVPVDSPARVTAADISNGFAAGDITLTYGPFVTLTGQSGGASTGMGGILDASSGEVTLDVRVQTAPWVDVDKIVVYLDGEVAARADIADDEQRDAVHTFTLNPVGDGFIIVEVTGDESLFPTVGPREFPSLQFDDVLDAVGGSFGLGSGGGLQPNLEFTVTPLAITNPLYIDADGDGEITPRAELPDPAARTASAAPADHPLVYGPAELQSTVSRESEIERAKRRGYQRWLDRRLPKWMQPTDHPRDARRVFLQGLNHAH